MRKFNLLLGLLLFGLLAIVPAGLFAQSLYLGTKTPYVVPGERPTPPPAGYRPVFINYVGRHGARYLTKSGPDLAVLHELETADRTHALTPLGERLLGIVERLCRIEKGQYENITVLGAAEQQAIGQRILDQYPGVFAGKGMDAVVTFKARTRQSADAFMLAFTGYKGAVHFSRKADSLDDVLRFYDLSPAYLRYKKSPAVKAALDTLDRDPRTAAVATAVCGRLFRPGYKVKEALGFTDNLYDLYSVRYSLAGEIESAGYAADSVDVGAALNERELDWEDFRSEAQDFLEKGPGRDPLGIQVKVAAPLLADLVRAMDEAAAGSDGAGAVRARADGAGAGRPDGVFRFTHAEAISPLASLLGIPEASVSAKGIYHYREHWRAERIIPLSANIQWIVYSNGRESLVRILLNEREVRLPIAGETGPYYRWEALRAYCVKRLAAVGSSLEADMLEYLRTLP